MGKLNFSNIKPMRFVRLSGLSLGIVLAVAGCGVGAQDIDARDSGQSEVADSQSTPAEVERGVFDYRDGGIGGDQLPSELRDAAMYLASSGLNIPKPDPEFNVLYGEIVSAEMQSDYRQWMDILIETLGGYDRWVHAIYEAGSPSSENSEILDGLGQLGYFEYGYDGPQEPSIDLVWEKRGCLVGFNSGPDFVRDQYSLCNQPEHWTDPDREFHRDMMGSLYFSYEILHEFAHEYHHHVQRAHSLGKEGADGNGPGAPVPPDGFSPTWYIEGSAGISPSWIMRDYFDDLSLSNRLNLTYQQVMLENLAPAALLGSDYGCPDWAVREFQETAPGPSGSRISKAQEVYEGQRSGIFGYEEPDSAWGCMNFYFMHLTSPQTVFVSFLEDQWSLGWHGSFQKHTGMTMDDFYIAFEKEMMAVDLSEDDAPPSWMSLPEEEFMDVVDYWSIQSGPLR